jgi:hypothetical protein
VPSVQVTFAAEQHEVEQPQQLQTPLEPLQGSVAAHLPVWKLQ